MRILISNLNSKFQIQILIHFTISIQIRFKFLFKSKLLGLVEAPAGVFLYVDIKDSKLKHSVGEDNENVRLEKKKDVR